MPRWLARLVRTVVPDRFADDLLADLADGIERRRGAGQPSFAWLIRELLRTPYVALWRQARRERIGVRGVRAAARRRPGPADALRSLAVAGRTLARVPGFALVSILTLASSIAALTLVLGVIDGILLRPLPHPEGGRLREVWGTNEAWRTSDLEVFRRNWDATDLTGFVVEGLAVRPREIDGMGGYRRAALRVDERGHPPVEIEGAWVTPGFFRTLGTRPLLGRVPTEREERTGASVVVISEALWSERYERDTPVLGRILFLEGTAYELIGVMPDAFVLPSEIARWWAPMRESLRQELAHVPALRAVVRLDAGADPEAAEAALAERLETLARSDPRYASVGVRLAPVREGAVRPVGGELGLLLSVGMLLLLLAIVNQGSLTVARATSRRVELATRAALGASRAGLGWLLVSEVILICAAAGCVATLVASLAMGPFATWLAESLPGFPGGGAVGRPGRLVAFTAMATLGPALVCGLLAVLVSRRRPATALKRRRGGRLGRRGRRALLLVEAALATVMAVGASLLVRSAVRVAGADLGFDPSVIHLEIEPGPDLGADDDVDRLGARLEAALTQVSGIRAAGRSDAPAGLGTWRLGSVRSGMDPPGAATPRTVTGVSPGYFETMGIRIVRGRGFRDADSAGAPRVAVLGELLARTLFADADPVGRTVFLAGAGMEGGRLVTAPDTALTVVGVATDVRLSPDEAYEPILYRPLAQQPGRLVHLVARPSDDPEEVAGAVLAAVRDVEPDVLVRRSGVLGGAMERHLEPIRVRMRIVLVLASLAALLTSVGVFGVVGYVVSDEAREIGVRMAFGARPTGELPRVVLEALWPLGTGALVGSTAGWLFGSSVEGFLFGVSASDPLAHGAALVLTLVPAVLAAALAARPVLDMDPSRVLTDG